jgi:hypothetical protein
MRLPPQSPMHPGVDSRFMFMEELTNYVAHLAPFLCIGRLANRS